MTVENDQTWTRFVVPLKATPETPDTPVAPESDPVEIPELAIKPETVAETPETPEVGDFEEDTYARLQLALSRLQRTWVPPDIVHQNRPSLLRVIAYAWAGNWGPQTGVWRTLGKIDAVLFAVPLVSLFYALAWIVERPARRFAAALFIAAVCWLWF